MAITRFFLVLLTYDYLVFKEQKSLEALAPSKLNKQASQQYEPEGSHSDCLYGNILRKEVIQPHLPIRLPCYDFTPIICPTFDG